jgi:hypothetical protein
MDRLEEEKAGIFLELRFLGYTPKAAREIWEKCLRDPAAVRRLYINDITEDPLDWVGMINNAWG